MRVQIIGEERFRERIPHILQRAPEALRAGIRKTAEFTVGQVQRHLAQGRPYPQTDTGRLTGSFGISQAPGPNALYVGSALPYAPVHEFGATIPAHYVAPRRAQALHWKAGGEDRFSKGHMIPPVNIPARPYVDPALDNARGEMEHIMSRELERIFGGN